MKITFSQEMVINLALDNPKAFSMDGKSYIIAEKGAPQMAEDGRTWFIGSFVAHLWHRGIYHFVSKFETIGGKQYISVEHKKMKKNLEN